MRYSRFAMAKSRAVVRTTVTVLYCLHTVLFYTIFSQRFSQGVQAQCLDHSSGQGATMRCCSTFVFETLCAPTCDSLCCKVLLQVVKLKITSQRLTCERERERDVPCIHLSLCGTGATENGECCTTLVFGSNEGAD